MNKKIALFGLSAFAAVLSMSSCTSVGEHKTSAELYYTNFTNADTGEYAFLRNAYKMANDEIAFADIISTKGTNAAVKALAVNLSTQYKSIQAKLEELATKADVLVPYAAMPAFKLSAGLDSAQSAVLEKAFLEQSVRNQEAIIEKFEEVSRNTKVATRDYASATLPTLEENLKETKALL